MFTFTDNESDDEKGKDEGFEDVKENKWTVNHMTSIEKEVKDKLDLQN